MTEALERRVARTNLGESTANDVSMRHGFLRESWKHISSNLHRFYLVFERRPLHPRHVLLLVIHPLYLYIIIK
jgi:hypothetical protein